MIDERGRTLDEVIKDLEGMRRKHGGSIEVLSSSGGVGFRHVSFSQEEQAREGVRNFIQVAGVDTLMTAKDAASKEQLEDWNYELIQIVAGLRSIEVSMFGFESHIENEWAKTQLAGFAPLLRFSVDRLEKVTYELG